MKDEETQLLMGTSHQLLSFFASSLFTFATFASTLLLPAIGRLVNPES
jgi:hypothetical protein